MKKYNILIIALFSLFAFSACDLDNYPGNTIPGDDAYETIDDCENALNGIYRSMYLHVGVLPALYDTPTDDIRYTNWADGSFTINSQFAWNAGSKTFDGSDSPWGILYDRINRANKLLNEIEKFPEDATAKRIKGEAYFFRAMSHFELLRLYGYKYDKSTASTALGIPYVKKAFDFNLKDRQTVSSNLADIHRDISLAEEYLQTRTTNPKSFLSKDALRVFQTRVYLYEEEYTKVIEAADMLQNNYTLSSSAAEFGYMWEHDLDFGEIIFMISFSSKEVMSDFSLSNNLYQSDYQTPGQMRSNFLPTDELVNLFLRNKGDIRTNIYFTYGNMYPGTSSESELIVVNKYPGNENLSKDLSVNQCKYFRYAEVLLNVIEATYYIDQAKASNLLNAFRKARISGYVVQNLSGEQLLNEIKIERRKEFAFEGMRFHDLRRWNQGFVRVGDHNTPTTHNISVAADDYHWLFPIPQAEMNAGDFSKEYQNPGYMN